ncbi:MAG: hypothetical protein UZ06_CHB003000545 [Chlorobi bacterium OLB6]|nr:MAG: hypothetical protein UZ06_CHB003000545 [Chlorobi bacterium OLB6]
MPTTAFVPQSEFSALTFNNYQQSQHISYDDKTLPTIRLRTANRCHRIDSPGLVCLPADHPRVSKAFKTPGRAAY